MGLSKFFKRNTYKDDSPVYVCRYCGAALRYPKEFCICIGACTPKIKMTRKQYRHFRKSGVCNDN